MSERKEISEEEVIRVLELFANDDEPDWVDRLARMALDLIQRKNEEIERLKGLCSKSSYKDSWKNKFFKAQEEIEYLKQHADQFLADYQKARKEIERLAEEKKEAYQQGFVDGNAYETKMDELTGRNEELQKQVDELTDKLGKVLLGVKADELLIAKGVEQAIKDTAKEIYDLMVGEYESYIDTDIAREIAERYGVGYGEDVKYNNYTGELQNG